MATRGSFPGVKRRGCEAHHSPPSSAEVKECVELYLYSPNKPSWRGVQLKDKDFTFTFMNVFRHLVGLFGRGIGPTQGPYLHRTTQHRTEKRGHTSMPRVGIEATIPVFKQPKAIHASDRSVIGTSKIKIYRAIILTVVLYGCETRSLNQIEQHSSRLFENRVLRIFAPKREDMVEGWRRLHNEVLHNLYTSPDITRVIKSRRMR
jgi:hypothetical protein